MSKKGGREKPARPNINFCTFHSKSVDHRSPMKNRILHVCLLGLLIFFVVFLKIDTYHLRWWDESIYAVNTFEMMQNANYFSLYFDGSADYYNCKPPLAIWLQVVSARIFGFNELAMRLPAAFAGAMCILITFLYSERKFGWFYAWCAALLLLTAQGFVGFHTSRTGDSDALLSLWTLLANLFFLSYLTTNKPSRILYFMIFLTLAFNTKMFAALLFSPAYLFLLIRHKKLNSFILNLNFIVGALIFVLTSFTFIYLRESDAPGYLNALLEKDAGRLLVVFENHQQPWSFYIDQLMNSQYTYACVLLLLAIYFVVTSLKDETRELLINMLILIASFLFILSISRTKLNWYIMPVFPYLSILSAFSISQVFSDRIRLVTLNKAAVLLLFVLFTVPYWMAFRRSQTNSIPPDQMKLEALEQYLYNRSNTAKQLNSVKVYTNTWKGSLLFYKYKYSVKGVLIDIAPGNEFQIGDRILVSNDSLYKDLQQRYEFDVIEKEKTVKLISIKQKNQNQPIASN